MGRLAGPFLSWVPLVGRVGQWIRDRDRDRGRDRDRDSELGTKDRDRDRDRKRNRDSDRDKARDRDRVRGRVDAWSWLLLVKRAIGGDGWVGGRTWVVFGLGGEEGGTPSVFNISERVRGVGGERGWVG